MLSYFTFFFSILDTFQSKLPISLGYELWGRSWKETSQTLAYACPQNNLGTKAEEMGVPLGGMWRAQQILEGSKTCPPKRVYKRSGWGKMLNLMWPNLPLIVQLLSEFFLQQFAIFLTTFHKFESSETEISYV